MSLERAKELDITEIIELDEMDFNVILGKKIVRIDIGHINDYISPSPQLMLCYTDDTYLIIGGSGTVSPHPKYLKYLKENIEPDKMKTLIKLQPEGDLGELTFLYFDGDKFYYRVIQDDGVEEYPKSFSKLLI